jgi:hypothetical protein
MESFKKILPYILIAIIFAGGGYFIGKGSIANQEASIFEAKALSNAYTYVCTSGSGGTSGDFSFDSNPPSNFSFTSPDGVWNCSLVLALNLSKNVRQGIFGYPQKDNTLSTKKSPKPEANQVLTAGVANTAPAIWYHCSGVGGTYDVDFSSDLGPTVTVTTGYGVTNCTRSARVKTNVNSTGGISETKEVKAVQKSVPAKN